MNSLHSNEETDISTINNNNQNKTKPPNIPGNYLEPWSHIYTNENPDHLLNFLHEFSLDKGIICNLRKDKYRIKCLYNCGEPLSFRINIFSSSLTKMGNYVIEFQRRSGDCLKFYDLYRSYKEEIYEKKYGINTHTHH